MALFKDERSGGWIGDASEFVLEDALTRRKIDHLYYIIRTSFSSLHINK